MSLPFPRASLEVDYPLYAVGFDPQDAKRLVVGGGGGAGRSGVGNKISVIETVDEGELRKAGEIDLSRDEDNVMSLALGGGGVGQPSNLFAGINSSPQDIAKGTNLHLRTFSIEQPKTSEKSSSTELGAKIKELSRSAFFQNPHADTYQRVLRIAGSVGAAASAMGIDPQIAIFDTRVPQPNKRGVLELVRDAEDLDVIQTGEDEYLLAFCYKYELHLFKIGEEDAKTELIYTMADDHGERPAFRSIRFLSHSFIIAASNLPGKSGVVLHAIRLPSPKNETRIAMSIRIPKRISATALAVANLSPPPSPIVPLGATQFVIAVAGNDSSLYLYSVEHKTMSTIAVLSELLPLYTLKNVHSGDNITGVAFSNFIPPKEPSGRQHIKLASISLQKGVAVHSIALKRILNKPTSGSAPTKNPPARYVTVMRPKPPSNFQLIMTMTLMVLFMAIAGQSILELVGHAKPVLHVNKFVPWLQGTLRDPEHPPAFFAKNQFVSKLAGSGIDAEETLVLWETEHPDTINVDVSSEGGEKKINLDVHDEEIHGAAKVWEELPEAQKRAWKQRLQQAGAWTQNMGDSIFKGILFGELAGAVGHAVAEGLA